MNKQLKDLKSNYEEQNTPIELEQMIAGFKKRRSARRFYYNSIISIVALMLIFFTSLNISPVLAANMAKIPGFQPIVSALTITKDDSLHKADITVPKVIGTSKEITALNAKFEKEGKELYKQFAIDAKVVHDGHIGIESDYIVKTEKTNLLSFGQYTVNTVASSSTTMKYTTIDPQKQMIITLPSLFKDKAYVNRISLYIEEQMKKEMAKEHTDKTYWVKTGKPEDDLFEAFTKIKKNQNFYINKKNHLVISFDKYEVGPGAMGIVEFEIPTKVINDLLLPNKYIK